jgi:hypothetical protein
MQRLALLAHAEEHEPGVERAQPGMAGYFGMGLLGGGIAGALVMLTAPMLVAGQPLPFQQPPAVPPAIAALATWMPEPTKHGVAQPSPSARGSRADAFDMVIDARSRASAPFGLRLVGAGDAHMEVLLRGLPASVVVSHGERRDASTWVVNSADLENLRLTLGAAAPEAFNIRIEVLAPPGVRAATSVARVRLVGVSGVTRQETASADAPRRMHVTPGAALVRADTPAQTRTVAHSPERAHTERVARRPVQPVATTTADRNRRLAHAAVVPETPPHAEPRHWPEGASGVGVLPRSSDRQVWWKLPEPAWSPFKDTAGR